MNDVREELAAYAHEAWSGWMRYLFSKCTVNTDGTVTIPAWAVDRWLRQAGTSYGQLPPSEQESDRDEADKMLAIMQGATAWIDGDPFDLMAPHPDGVSPPISVQRTAAPAAREEASRDE